MRSGPENHSGRLVLESVHKEGEDLKIDALRCSHPCGHLEILHVPQGHVPHIKTH